LLNRTIVTYTGKKRNKLRSSNENTDLVCGHRDTPWFSYPDGPSLLTIRLDCHEAVLAECLDNPNGIKNSDP